MTWMPLLLTDPSPCLRWLVLRDLFHRPADDPELLELSALRETDGRAVEVLALQLPDGSWPAGALALGRAGGSRTLMTAFALTRLGYLGFDGAHPAVGRGAEFLFSRQRADGSWPLSEELSLTDGSSEMPARERYSMIPLQTSLPLRGLAACGYAADHAPSAPTNGCWLNACRTGPGRPERRPVCTAMWRDTAAWRTRAGAAAPTPPER